jgi:flagellar basal-body rod protein FlgC
MLVGHATSSAASGLRVQTARLAQSAANVANVNTDGYEATTVDSVSRLGAGASASTASTYGPFATPIAQDSQAVPASDTDLAAETVTQLSSLRAFQANVAVLQTANVMVGDLVDQRA